MRIQNSGRRSFIKLLAAAPLLSQSAIRELYAQAATAIGKDPRQNVYTQPVSYTHLDVYKRQL